MFTFEYSCFYGQLHLCVIQQFTYQSAICHTKQFIDDWCLPTITRLHLLAHQECQIWHALWVLLASNVTIFGLLKISFSTFLLTYLWPIWPNLDAKFDIRVLVSDYLQDVIFCDTRLTPRLSDLGKKWVRLAPSATNPRPSKIQIISELQGL